MDSEIPHRTKINRKTWHQPKVSIIITHYNYSKYLQDAILSVLDQTHRNFELVIVDDASAPDELERARKIVSNHGPDVRLIELPENVGQISAFFAGFDDTDGEFVCALDPDDRYAETFLEEALAAHLGVVMCPMLSVDMYLLKGNSLISGGYHALRRKEWVQLGDTYVTSGLTARTYFFSPVVERWPWCTTSALMFRRSALNYLRPHKSLGLKRALDAYLAQGCHYLGGTLYHAKPLVYRTLHSSNSFISDNLFSSFQERKRPDAVSTNFQTLALAKEVLLHNRAPTADIRASAPNPASHFIRQRKKPKNILSRLVRSIKKRLGWAFKAFL